MSEDKTKDKKVDKLRYLELIIAELVSTEEEYIKKMSCVVEGYLAELRKKDAKVPVPEDLKNHKGLLVFANIEEIYSWHKDFFYPALMKHRHSAADLGKAFVSCESQFHMYAKYCNNKALSEFIVAEHSKYFEKVRHLLKHKYEIRDFLITPVQRIGKYKLLLCQIVDHLKVLEGDWKNVMEAYNIIEVVNKNCNDCTTLQGIKNYDGDVFDNGKLIFHETLMCKYNNKKRRHYVFLFKRLLIFTNKHDSKKKYDMPTYNYKLQIPMNKLQLRELPNKCFKLKSTDPKLQDLNLTCYGETEELYAKWLEEIQKQLRMQANLITDLVNPTGCDEREVLM